MARQEAQLATASLLVPELLERFREACDRLVKISLSSEARRRLRQPFLLIR